MTRVALTFRYQNEARQRRTGEPVSVCVPLPQGTRPDDAWPDLATSSIQTAVLDQWPDGSPRVLQVHGRVDCHDSASPMNPVALPECSLVVTERNGSLNIASDALRARVSIGSAFPFASLETAATALEQPRMTLSDGVTTIAPTVEAFELEESGPHRVVVRCTAATHLAGRPLEIEARVEFFAGLSTIRCLATLRNLAAAQHPGNFWDLGDPGSCLLKDFSWTFGIATGTHAINYSTDAGKSFNTAHDALAIYQDSSGGAQWMSSNHVNRRREVPNTFRGFQVQGPGISETGLRAEPIVKVGAGASAVTVAVPQFWQNFPRAIRVANGHVSLGFFPAEYSDLHELQGGEQKTQEWFVSLGDDGITDAPLAWCLDRTLVSVDPAFIASSNGVDFCAPLAPAHAQLVASAVDGPDAFDAKRERIDEYGWRHFGDIYGDHEAIGHAGSTPLVSHYNNQYDPLAGFALQYLRTADARWFRAMQELAGHVKDIDIYHTSRDRASYNGGLFWHTYHYGDADTATHRTYPRRNTGKTFGGGPSADHNYTTGLMLHYFITGDRTSRDAALGLAQYVLNIDDGRLSRFRWLSHARTGQAHATFPDFYGPARSSGNSLNAVLDGYRLSGNVRFLHKADELVQTVIHPADDLKAFRLDEPEYRWFYTMFLQALGKYLCVKASLGQIDRPYAHAHASLLHYARWMAAHEYPYLERPEKLEFPTETWAAQDIRKSDAFCFAAAIAPEHERARFLERAAFFHDASIDRLSRMATRTLARPVVVMLTSGYMMGWTRQRPDWRLPESGDLESFGVPRAFVPQKTIARRRAIALATAGALLAVAGVAAVALELLG